MSAEKLWVITTRIAIALPDDCDPDEIFDVMNLVLIPLQRENDPTSCIIDYQFDHQPVLSPTPVEPYDRDNGFTS